MFCWRITKYNPEYRNSEGIYTKKEWTSFSEIGESYNNKAFTLDQYLEVENAYINAIQSFMSCTKTTNLQVNSLEKNSDKLTENELYTQEICTFFNMTTNNMETNKEQAEIIARLVLREDVWCKLESPNMYVHFGWDYYMYIGSSEPCSNTIAQIEQTGLFVEAYQSPYKS